MRNFNWKCVVIVLAVVSITGIFGAAFYMNGGRSFRDFISNNMLLENLYYLMQLIVGVSMIVGAVIGVWQYVLTARCQRASMGKECIQKAIDLAEYYKDNILPEYSVFNFIYEESGMNDVLKKISKEKMINFDNVELNSNLSKDDFEQLLKLMKSEKMERLLKERERLYEDAAAREYKIMDIDMVISRSVNRVLNDMEFFAMNFTHGTADESVVYQSLHQTYLAFVQMFYFNISLNNVPNGKQFYTNVIELYSIWYNRSESKKSKIVSQGRKIIEHGSMVDRLND